MLDKLHVVQNAEARVVTSSPYRTPSTPLLKSLHWLLVRSRITCNVQDCTLVFKIRTQNEPVYLSELLGDYVPSRSLYAICFPRSLICTPLSHESVVAS